MRAAFAFGLAIMIGACGTDGGGGGGDDDPNPPGDGNNNGGDLNPPAVGFQLQSPEITIMPGQEITYCWYFRTPNTKAMVIKRWESAMTAGSHHMIMYTSQNDMGTVGSVTSANCGIGGAGGLATWTYAAQTQKSELQLPTDDGTGKPLGMDIAANSPGFLQMHYLNSSDTPIKARVTLNAEAFDDGVAYTRTAAYVTYNGNISIPAMTSNHVESLTCNTPAGAQFWAMSTHSHKQAMHTAVKDGGAMVFESTMWEHPGVRRWDASPYFTFATNKLTYACTYNNPTNRTITDGDSAATDEMCMATGYFFPATRPVFCYNTITF